MLLAAFNVAPGVCQALLGIGSIELVDCSSTDDEVELATALAAAERELERSRASAALIGGSGPWALGAALACAKAVVPYAYIGGDRRSGHYGGHIGRLASLSLVAADDPAAVVQRWLAELGDS